THPPLLERIRLLDPGFDPRHAPPVAVPPPRAAAETAAHGSAGLAPRSPPQAMLDPLARAGTIDAVEIGRELRAALPQTLHDAATQRESSLLLLFALAITPDGVAQAPQWQLLTQQLGAARTTRCRRLHEALAALDRRLRLPLVEIALPALRQRPAEQLRFA